MVRESVGDASTSVHASIDRSFFRKCRCDQLVILCPSHLCLCRHLAIVRIHESCHFTQGDTIQNATTIAQRNGFCSRSKFEHIYKHLLHLDRKFIAVQYIPNITNSQREQLQQESADYLQQINPAIKYGGIRDYRAYPNGTFQAIVPSPERPFYFPIHHVQPIAKNEMALDLVRKGI